MGRPRKSEHEKLVAGTARKDRVDPSEGLAPSYPLLERVTPPPKNLTKDGIELWNELLPLLVGVGIMQTVDIHALEQLCVAWQNFRHKSREGYEVSASDHNALRGLFQEFGLTPASRRRVVANHEAAAGGVGGGQIGNRFSRFRRSPIEAERA